MKLNQIKNDRYTFALTRNEKMILFHLLEQYPPAHQRMPKLSRSAEFKNLKEAQQLLEESLAAKKRENKKKLAAVMERNSRFIEHENGFTISLNREEIEWLLQVLNEVRVGLWIALGSPSDPPQSLSLTPDKGKLAWMMDIAGYFEMGLLRALNSEP